MTDTLHASVQQQFRDQTNLSADAKEAHIKMQQQADPALPQAHNAADQRSINLEILREQLRAAKIPLTKRGSIIAEVPHAASDCTFVDGTTRCKLSLCEDSCEQAHSHHRTHQAPIKADTTLVYSRPSISLLPGSNLASNIGSPAASRSVSQSNSPVQQYRRASAFGFNLGGRGSVVNSIGGFSGAATPADLAMSSPPSPLSGSSRDSSAPASPRAVDTNHFVPDFTIPIKEGSEEERENSLAGMMEPTPVQMPVATASSSSAAIPDEAYVPAGSNMGLSSQFWKLRHHIINLMDYRPSLVGKNTPESLSRQDLAPAPREDFGDQEHPEFDPRSPHPPSPMEEGFDESMVSRVNINQDAKGGEIQYEIKRQ